MADPLKIGVISDTHGYLDPVASRILDGVDMILHAGDVGTADVLNGLEAIAPVTAVSGNHEDEVTSKLKWLETVEARGVKIALTHRFFPMNMHEVANVDRDWREQMGVDGVRLMVFGHSHEPLTVDNGTLMYYNPGYAGPDMTEPIRTVGLLTVINNRNITAETYFLSPPPRTEYLDKARLINNFVEDGR